VVGGSDHGVYTMAISSGRKTRQLYTKQYGHTEWVTCVAHLADGRILSGGMDSKLCLWDARGVRCTELTGHHGSVSVVRGNTNGTLAFSGGYDKTVRIWDTKRRAELSSLVGHKGPVLDLVVAHGSVLSGGRDGMAIIWDVGTGAPSRKLRGHQGHITSVQALRGDLNLFVTGAQDGHVKVWDPRQAGSLVDLPLHAHAHGSGAVVGIEDAPGAGGLMVTAGADNQVQVVDPRASFTPRHTFTEHRDFIYSLLVAGRLAVSGGGDGMLLVHDLEQGRLLYGLGANSAAVRGIGATRSHLVAAGDDGNVRTALG